MTMEQMPVDPAEMELRRNLDVIASLRMIGEGAPVFDYEEPEAFEGKDSNRLEGYHEDELPSAYQ